MALSQPATFNEEWSDERVFAYLSRGEPNNLIDFADIRPMHRAKRVSAAQVVNRTDWQPAAQRSAS